MTFKTPRGTYDIMPSEMEYHRKVIDTTRFLSARFGFEEMSTPIFEFTDVFEKPLGESSDIIGKETYTFEDRGGRSLTLRSEGTAGIVRAVISNDLTQTLPRRFFYSGPMFRYERPQKGRMRQFHQVGIELLGGCTARTDCEVIEVAAEVLEELKVIDKCVLHINTLGDEESRLNYREALIEHFEIWKEELSIDSKNRLKANPLRILDSKDSTDRVIVADAPKIYDYLNDSSKDHFDHVLAHLDLSNIKYKVNPTLVRGLDYYCHTTFEFITDELGSQGTILGGGRYDGLSEMLGGPPMPGVGWAAGIERLVMLMKS